MFKRILYATDGSDHAGKAMDLTRELAKMHGAEVIVVHAYAPVPESLGTPDYDRILNKRLEAATAVMDEAASPLEQAGLKVVRELLSGADAESILSVAATRGADLIVMGARGLSDFQGLLLGSVSHKVIQHAQCPVLVAR